MTMLISTREGLVVRDGEKETLFREGVDFLALARAPGEPSVCYAATSTGSVYRSTDGGRKWKERGVAGGFDELSALAVHPEDPDHLLAGMEPSALLRSRDGGCSWEEDAVIRRMSGEQGWSVPWGHARGHVRSIAIDPHDPRRVYLAIEVGGIVRTENGGETWENVHGGIHDDVHAVAVNPRNGSALYAATRHGFGISHTYGRTWHAVNGFEGQGYCRPLAVDPREPQRVYTVAATTGPGGFRRKSGSEAGVFRSEDAGRSWERLTEGIPTHFKPYIDALDVEPGDPGHLALADAEGNVYESRDCGDHWTSAGRVPPARRLLFVA